MPPAVAASVRRGRCGALSTPVRATLVRATPVRVTLVRATLVRATLVWATLVCAVLAACTGRAQTVPVDGVELAYHRRTGGAAPAAVRVYRTLAARSLGSACALIPSDSEAYALRSRRCSAPANLVRAVARLLLERAASPRFLRPAVYEGRLRWVDASDSCMP